NSTGGVAIDEVLMSLAKKALDELPAEPEAWRPGEAPPPELESVLGRWWAEGTEFVFRWRDGALQAIVEGQPAWKPPSVFEREGEDLYRVKSGLERGELLRISRDEAGAVTKLYWASYPFSRSSKAFYQPDA
ncbi:MAG: hypothetical protein QOE36_1982, partial [Gaiellaceae bacterium]|nr:hypothetical protein [Gaiellaceae bacterium]